MDKTYPERFIKIEFQAALKCIRKRVKKGS